LPDILRAAPKAIGTYYEPFVGGGAVFFALALGQRFERAVLGDANDELIACYRALQTDVDAVILALKRHRYDEDYYYRLRERDPAAMSPAARAARLIYLNRCGYNGLYRVNSKGRFNVPFGRYANPRICDEEGLRAAADALQRARLVAGDFEAAMGAATPDDFVYLDPPYVPLSATSSFTAYARERFGDDEQKRLADALRALRARKVPALLSNSDCVTTRRLYRGLPFDEVPVRRAINSVAAGRGSVGELLVRSFDWSARSGTRAKQGAWHTSTTSKKSTKPVSPAS
jgi:DNA adenine methylase